MTVYTGVIEDLPTFPTGPTTGTYVLGPFPFTPKAIFAMAVGDNDDEGFTPGDDWRLSYGFAADGSSTRAVNMQVEERAFYPWHFVESASVAGTHLLRWGGNVPQTNIVVSSWDDCQITLTVSNPGHADLRVYYVVFGGDTLEAFVGSVTVQADGDPTVVTGIPFEPDLILFLGGNNSSSSGYLSVGWGLHNLDQYAVGKRVIDNNTPGASISMGDDAVARDFDWAAALTDLTSDGFEITPTDNPGSDQTVYYMAIHDPNGDFATGVVPLEDDTVDDASFGFQADALLTLMGFDPQPGVLPGGSLVTGMFGEDGLNLGSDRSGVVGVGTYYQGGGSGDPFAPPRFSFQYLDNDRLLSLWVPVSGFSGGPYPETEIATVDFDGWVAGDGFTYDEDTQQAAVAAGGYPSPTWPAAPATEWAWLALKASEATAVDPCAPDAFVGQIYRRL